MDHALLADLIVVAHLVYVGFVALGFVAILAGGALGWRWVRRYGFRIPHLVCTLIVAVEAVLGIVCPLTEWEAELRRSAGQTPEELSFVARLVRDVLFYEAPQWVFTASYVAFAALVLFTWFGIPARRRPRGPDPVS